MRLYTRATAYRGGPRRVTGLVFVSTVSKAVSYRGALAWALAATPQNRDGLDPRRKSPPETDFSFGLLSPSEVMGC